METEGGQIHIAPVCYCWCRDLKLAQESRDIVSTFRPQPRTADNLAKVSTSPSHGKQKSVKFEMFF